MDQLSMIDDLIPILNWLADNWKELTLSGIGGLAVFSMMPPATVTACGRIVGTILVAATGKRFCPAFKFFDEKVLPFVRNMTNTADQFTDGIREKCREAHAETQSDAVAPAGPGPAKPV